MITPAVEYTDAEKLFGDEARKRPLAQVCVSRKTKRRWARKYANINLKLLSGNVLTLDAKEMRKNLKKPDARIYELLLNRFDITGSTALFIDDSLPNVTASIASGLPAVHFNSPEQLRADLVARGVL